MKCELCGAENEHSEEICSSCGAPLGIISIKKTSPPNKAKAEDELTVGKEEAVEGSEASEPTNTSKAGKSAEADNDKAAGSNTADKVDETVLESENGNAGAQEEQVVSEPDQLKDGGSGTKKYIKYVATAVVVLLLGAGAFWGSKLLNKNDSVEQYVKALNGKDFAQVVQLLDSDMDKNQFQCYAEQNSNKGNIFAVLNGKLEDVKFLNKKEAGEFINYELEARTDGTVHHFDVVVNKKTNKIVLPEKDFVKVKFNVPEGTEVTIDECKVDPAEEVKLFIGEHKLTLKHELMEFTYNNVLNIGSPGTLEVVESGSLKGNQNAIIEAAALAFAKDIFKQVKESDTVTFDKALYESTADENGKITKLHAGVRQYLVKNAISDLTVLQGTLQPSGFTLPNKKIGVSCKYVFEGSYVKDGVSRILDGSFDLNLVPTKNGFKVADLNLYDIHFKL